MEADSDSTNHLMIYAPEKYLKPEKLAEIYDQNKVKLEKCADLNKFFLLNYKLQQTNHGGCFLNFKDNHYPNHLLSNNGNSYYLVKNETETTLNYINPKGEKELVTIDKGIIENLKKLNENESLSIFLTHEQINQIITNNTEQQHSSLYINDEIKLAFDKLYNCVHKFADSAPEVNKVVIAHFTKIADDLLVNKKYTPEEINNSAQELHKKLMTLQPEYSKLKEAIYGVFGAIIGAVVGAVAGFIFGNGFGSLIGGATGAAVGFGIGVKIANSPSQKNTPSLFFKYNSEYKQVMDCHEEIAHGLKPR